LARAYIRDLSERAPASGALAAAGREVHAEPLCRQAAVGDERTVAGVLKIVEGLVAGREHPVSAPTAGQRSSAAELTFKDVGDMWTSGDLAKRFRRRVKEVGHAENMSRLVRYVYPVIGVAPIVLPSYISTTMTTGRCDRGLPFAPRLHYPVPGRSTIDCFGLDRRFAEAHAGTPEGVRDAPSEW
jgi:hypothetical protein